MRIIILTALLAFIGLVNATFVNIKKHKTELFKVHLIETKSYTVHGHTCEVEMIYIEGSLSGKYFNGDLIYQDSTNVIKKYKTGKMEANARFYVNGTDYENNAGHLHFEDIFVGYDSKGRTITRPNIFTDVQNLAWLPKADVIGIAKKTYDGKIITYMWNEKNTEEKPYRAPQFPDETKEYTQPVLTIDVIPGGLGFDGFYGVDGTGVGKLGFTCTVNTTEFQGASVDNFVDTRYDVAGQAQGVSARYIIEGTDKYGKKMRIYVENNGVDDNGDNLNVRTEPIIITDNPRWAWIETAPLHGTHAMIGNFSYIYFWTVEGADKKQTPGQKIHDFIKSKILKINSDEESEESDDDDTSVSGEGVEVEESE